MKKKILFVLLLGLILYPANKVTNYNISSVDYKEGNEVDNQIEVEWQKNWGGNDYDFFTSIVETQDGYIAVGYSSSADIEGLTNKGSYDAIIVKYDKNGNTIWQKNWGGNSDDRFNSIIETQDGYIIVGYSKSNDIEGITNKGSYDTIIVKYDKNGNIIWQKNWGGNSSDEFSSIIETQDGYVAVGNSYSSDIEGLTNKGSDDAIIVKYDKNGNIIWQKNWGGNSSDRFPSIIETQDGYIIVGYSKSNDIEGLTNKGSYDTIIVKYDKNGNIIWQKNWGGNSDDIFKSIIETQDGYIAVGYSYSSDIEYLTHKGMRDVIIIKYDKNGNVIWQKNWGGNSDDRFNSIIETQDEYVTVGNSDSSDIEGLINKGDRDTIIVKYDKNGNIIWQKSWGGNGVDSFNSIIETQDGYLAVGGAGSADIENLTNKGGTDAIIVKYKSLNNVGDFNDIEVSDSNSQNNNDNVSIENNSNNSSIESNIKNNQETIVDAPNTLSFISKTLLIISGLLIVFGIGLYGYNLYKLKKDSK